MCHSCEAAGRKSAATDRFQLFPPSLQLVLGPAAEDPLDRGGPDAARGATWSPSAGCFLNGAPGFKHKGPQSRGWSLLKALEKEKSEA